MFFIKSFILVTFVLLVILLEKFARKKWNIPRKDFVNRYVNDMHRWIDYGIIVVYLILAFIYIFVFEYFNIVYLIFTFLLVQYSVRIWMEWKYDRQSKEYMITIGGIGSIFIAIALMKYLFF